MSRQRQSTWLVLFLLAVLEGQVYCINGRVVKSRIGFDEWETYKFNPNSRKLSHDGNKSSRTDTPSSAPSVSFRPTATPAPSLQPSIKPSVSPSRFPSFVPTFPPTDFPTNEPSDMPSIVPSRRPSLEPSIQPSLVPTDSPVPSAVPTALIELNVNEREDGTLEYITDCIAKMPENASDVTEQLVEFQYKLFLQEGANPKDAVDYVENTLHTNVAAEFIGCPYKNSTVTGLPFETRSLNSFPKDDVLKSCDDEVDVDAAPCFLIGAGFTIEIFSYMTARRLQQSQTVDLRVSQAFGPFLDDFFSSERFSGLNSDIVGVNFEGFTNAQPGLPTYGGNGGLSEKEPDTSGIEGEVASDNNFNKGPVVAGILAVSAAAIILVVIVAMAYRKRRQETLDVEKLKERGVIRPEESLAKAMDSLDDDSFLSKDDYSVNDCSVNPTQRAYVVPDDASTAAGSAILREYSSKYSRNEKVTFWPAFISTGSIASSVLPANANRKYNSSDTVDL